MFQSLCCILSSGLMCAATATLRGAIISPFTEDFSSGTNELNMSPFSSSLEFNNIIYTVDGDGGVALFNTQTFLGAALENFSGLGVIGDWTWTGSTENNVHNFTVALSDASAFALTGFDWATGNSGPPTEYTISGYLGSDLIAQIVTIDLTVEGTYAVGTANEILATDIGPGDDSGYGLNLSFAGSNWKNIDRFVFTASGNDIVVALDNIQLAAAIPETSTALLLTGGVLLASTRRRRTA